MASSQIGTAGVQQEGNSQDGKATKAVAAPRLTALDAPRWIASAHVVGFHYYSRSIGYFSVGGMWTQFFFVMSGFLLAYVEMAKPEKKRSNMSQLQYLRKRLVTVYPVYILSLLLMVFNLADRSAFTWGTLPLQVFLLQAILPICSESSGSWQCTSYGFNSVSWFISCLVVYWLVLRPASRYFERVSLRKCCVWLLALWLWSLIPVIVFAVSPMPYLVFVKNATGAGPFGYLHVFLSGIVTARVFVLTALRDVATGERPAVGFSKLTLAAEDAPLVFRYGCCIGYLLWAAFARVFWILKSGVHPDDLPDDLFYRFFHTGGIMPAMSLVLVGGAVGTDPLAKHVFQCKLFRTLGRISYSQYLLQMPVSIFLAYYLCPGLARAQARLPSSPQEPAFQAAFPFALLGFAYLTQRYVEAPYADWQRRRAQDGVLGGDERAMASLKSKAARVAARWQQRPRAAAHACCEKGDLDLEACSEVSTGEGRDESDTDSVETVPVAVPDSKQPDSA